jgi:GxxExxY protein
MKMPEPDKLTELIIGAAIEVRKRVGAGLLESAYHTFLCIELTKRSLTFTSQPTLPVVYDGHRVELAYRPDLIVKDRVIVELKTVSAFSPVHQAQILTYLRLSGIRIGLLINFHAVPFKSGIRRFIV